MICRWATASDGGVGTKYQPGLESNPEGGGEDADAGASIDEFTDSMKKTGYAWVRVELDTGEPLKPSVLIRKKK